MLAAQTLHCLNSGGFLWPALPILSASLVHRVGRILCPTYALHQPVMPMIIKYRWMSVHRAGVWRRGPMTSEDVPMPTRFLGISPRRSRVAARRDSPFLSESHILRHHLDLGRES
jgi:hypothetical protein